MSMLVLLVIDLFLPYGQLAGQKVVYGVGIKLCNVLCIQRGSCMSFSYDLDRLACHLSHKDARNWTMARSVIYPKKKTDQTSGGACSTMACELNTRCVERRGGGAVCVEGATAISTLESSCSTDWDCSAVRGFVCFKNTCKCIPGYRFNPSDNSCVRSCNVYGDTFTTYQGLSIDDNNDRNIKNKSVDQCSEMCIREKAFVCVTCETDIARNLCQLSTSGYLDVPLSMRSRGDAGWILAVRNCA